MAKDYGIAPLMMLSTLSTSGEENIDEAYKRLGNEGYPLFISLSPAVVYKGEHITPQILPELIFIVYLILSVSPYILKETLNMEDEYA